MFLSTIKNNENSSYLIIAISIILPLLFKIIPFHIIHDYLIEYFKNDNNFVKITITSHSIPVVRSYSTAKHTKMIYSDYFLAIVYYLSQNNFIELNSLTEVLTSHNELNVFCDYSDSNKSTFIFMPIQKNKIKICNENDIYCEFNLIENKNSNNDNNNNNKKESSAVTSNSQYIIILSIKKKSGSTWSRRTCSNTDPLDLSKVQGTTKENMITDIQILKNFIDSCIDKYEKKKNMKNNSILYNFEYRGSEKSENGNLILHFNEHIMEHNKDLSTNIFFEGKDKLIKYITPFIYDPLCSINSGEEKYKKSGFTFKAGLLFYGSPGCGKTSTIKAILKYTNRNGIILNMSKIKTCEELETIFRIKKINDKTYSGKQLCFILEDCDAFDISVIKSRKEDNKIELTPENKDKNISEEKNTEKNTLLELSTILMSSSVKQNNIDELNLSCFLNILDGIIELNGVMIILTTNYPEKIDEALIRPGRIDFKHEFKKATHKTVCEMLKFKFDISDKDFLKYNELLIQIKDEVVSPAEFQSICFQNDSIEECLKQILLIQRLSSTNSQNI